MNGPSLAELLVERDWTIRRLNEFLHARELHPDWQYQATEDIAGVWKTQEMYDKGGWEFNVDHDMADGMRHFRRKKTSKPFDSVELKSLREMYSGPQHMESTIRRLLATLDEIHELLTSRRWIFSKLGKLGVEFAGTSSHLRRWSMSDLATDLAGDSK